MADIGYIYVNAVTSYGVSLTYPSLVQSTARYELSNPDDLIIYIEETKATNLGINHEVHSNAYYVLGKGTDTTVKGSAFKVYVRGEQQGARYDSSDMAGFSYSTA